MNFQEKLFEATADLRARAAEFARVQAEAAAQGAEKLKGSLDVVTLAGRELNKVARRHATQFVKQNASLASKVRDDVSALARTTFDSLRQGPAAQARKPNTRKATARKRKSRAKAA
jgi:hypothetical protein